jgi:hypothetical protein
MQSYLPGEALSKKQYSFSFKKKEKAENPEQSRQFQLIINTMSNTITILSVIDCESIINNTNTPAGTVGNPTNLGSYSTSDAFVYMMTKQAYAMNAPSNEGDGSSELKVTANVGDTLRWTITSIDQGVNYNAILQSINLSTNNALQTPVNLEFGFSEYVGPQQPTNGGTTALSSVSYSDYLFQSTVLNTSSPSVQYSITFYVADTNGNILGYYCWDPFIVIQN